MVTIIDYLPEKTQQQITSKPTIISYLPPKTQEKAQTVDKARVTPTRRSGGGGGGSSQPTPQPTPTQDPDREVSLSEAGGEVDRTQEPISKVQTGVKTVTPEEAKKLKGGSPAYVLERGDEAEIQNVLSTRTYYSAPGQRRTRGQYEATASSIIYSKSVLGQQRTKVSGFLLKSPEEQARTPGVTITEKDGTRQYQFSEEFFKGIRYGPLWQASRTEAKEQFRNLPEATKEQLTTGERIVSIQKFVIGGGEFGTSQVRSALYGGQIVPVEKDGKIEYVRGDVLKEQQRFRTPSVEAIKDIPLTTPGVKFTQRPGRYIYQTLESPGIVTTGALTAPLVYKGGQSLITNVRTKGFVSGSIYTASQANPVQFKVTPRTYAPTTKAFKIDRGLIDTKTGRYVVTARGAQDPRVELLARGIKTIDGKQISVVATQRPYTQISYTRQGLTITQGSSPQLPGYNPRNVIQTLDIVGTSAQPGKVGVTVARTSTINLKDPSIMGGVASARVLRSATIQTGSAGNVLTPGYTGPTRTTGGIYRFISGTNQAGIVSGTATPRVYKFGTGTGFRYRLDPTLYGRVQVVGRGDTEILSGGASQTQKTVLKNIAGIQAKTPTITQTTSKQVGPAVIKQPSITQTKQQTKTIQTLSVPQVTQKQVGYSLQSLAPTAQLAGMRTTQRTQTKQQVKLMGLSAQRTAPIQNIAQTPAVRQQVTTALIQAPRQKQKLTSVYQTPRIINPYPTQPGPAFNFGRAITAPGFTLGLPLGLPTGTKTRIIRGRAQRLGYTPSLRALIFNIRGPKPKGTFTGFRFRPIPKGWSLGGRRRK